MSEINNDFDPITGFLQLEGPISEGFEDLLMTTGIQQVLDRFIASLGLSL